MCLTMEVAQCLSVWTGLRFSLGIVVLNDGVSLEMAVLVTVGMTVCLTLEMAG